MKAALAAQLLVSAGPGLNILMSNDDGFGSSNIREFYRLLVAAGHNVYMVAPAFDQSGQGGRFQYTTSATLDTASQYNLVPADAPSVGQDPHDSRIWYYNGTPAACASVGLDYVLPTFAEFAVPDLFVSGPNFGNNIGTFVYTASGTIGAAYYAVERSVPAIAFSAANPTRSYLDIDPNGTDPSTLAAQQAVRFVDTIARHAAAGRDHGDKRQPILPTGYGINVNIPPLNASCVDPPFAQARFGGHAGMPRGVYNASSGLVGILNNDFLGLRPEGANRCVNGDCGLPGESDLVLACQTAWTIFTVDYDAPLNNDTATVRSLVLGDKKNA